MKIDLDDAGPSEAARVSQALLARGLSRDDFRPEDLAETYGRLRRVSHAPDFAAARLCRPTVPPAVSAAPVVAVIVETRPHPNLDFVVGLVHDMLGIPIQVFHAASNRAFVEGSSIGALAAAGAVTLTELGGTRFSSAIYNGLFLDRGFWDTIIGRGKILVFQTDAVLCRRSRYRLGDFLGFDYIGAAWERERPVGLCIDGGNGGLSLRDWGHSVAVLDRFPPAEAWTGGEDGFFGFHIELIGGRVGRPRDCARFCTQFAFLDRSFGIHKPSGLSRVDRLAIRLYCPDVRRVM